MCPQAPTAAASAAPPAGRVTRCERIAAGPRAALVRVTVAAASTEVDLAGARLVVVDGARTLRCDALPSPVRAGASRHTLGFAVTRGATPVALVLGERVLALAETDEEAEHRLAELRARLRESHGTCATLRSARREALRAAATAQVAAHDASARADALARELESARRQPWLRRRSPRPAAARPRARAAAAGERRAGAWRARSGSRLALGAFAVAPATLVAAILAWPAGGGEDRGGGALPAARASAVRPAVATVDAAAKVDALAARLKIPRRYLALYRQAAARYGLDWSRLAAVGAIESQHGQAQLAGVLSGTNPDGARGPAQFLAGTWERFGLDGDGDGDRDPHDASDAVHAMASYLRASGAPQDWRGALRSYNHSDAYVDAVERLAARLRSGAA